MRETLFKEIVALAKRWNHDLTETGNKDQLGTWLEDFGRTPDEILRLAFEDLRETSIKWPTYGHVRAAIHSAKMRLRVQTEAARAKTEAQQGPRATVTPGNISAAVAYAISATRRGEVESDGVADMVERILRGDIHAGVEEDAL